MFKLMKRASGSGTTQKESRSLEIDTPPTVRDNETSDEEDEPLQRRARSL